MSATPIRLYGCTNSGHTIADISCVSYLYWLHEAHLSIAD